MGGSSYSFSSRAARSESEGYKTKSVDKIFSQLKEKKIHSSMDPKTIRLREARDSEAHPLSFPIIFGMDVTGSMGDIPKMLIGDGLPKMVSDIIQKGIDSPALLFLALGDSQAGDQAPLQVGQFESGDLEMDVWLTRTWPEGKGGGNRGESYLWAWYFAAEHCKTDHFEKRGKKGVLITFGDEPCLPTITKGEFKEVMDLDLQGDVKAEELLLEAQKQWNVYHLQLTEHRPTDSKWKTMLGQNLIEVNDYRKIPSIVAEICANHHSDVGVATAATVPEEAKSKVEKPKIML